MPGMTDERKRRFIQPPEAIVFDDEPEETEAVPEAFDLPNDRLRQAARLLWEGYP